MNLFWANYSFLLQRGPSVVFVLEVFVSDHPETSKYLKTPFGIFKSLGTAYMEVSPPKIFWDEIFEVNGHVFEFVRVLE